MASNILRNPNAFNKNKKVINDGFVYYFLRRGTGPATYQRVLSFPARTYAEQRNYVAHELRTARHHLRSKGI